METPTSTRRVTRSQTLASSASSNNPNLLFSRKSDESEMSFTKSRQRSGKKPDRYALIDITNDSPIVGLAMGHLETPSSKKKINGGGGYWARTPGSGEDLLRGQVKSLLQKVEEEADLSKITLENRAFLRLATSPVNLLAPTPANTPQMSDGGLPSVSPSPVAETFLIPQIFDEKKDESENVIITRSLLLDFYEKSDLSDCSSVVTAVMDSSVDENDNETENSSIWSIQANASSNKDDYEDEDGVVDEEVEEIAIEHYGDEDEDDCVESNNDVDIDAICEGMMNVSVGEGPRFAGKHIRFVYNSDDEVEGAEEVLHLKGLPTPKGKHIRFPEE